MKKFQFIPNQVISEGTSQPTHIKKTTPVWYKKAELTFKGTDGEEHDGLKACLPFLDAMIVGYALTVPVDLHVTATSDGGVSIQWDRDVYPADVLKERVGDTGSTIPRPVGYRSNHLIWLSEWGWKVPRGYSVLVTHPLNRFELPFTTMSAIVDSDKYYSWGNIPFFLAEGFEGVIPAGTPYAQLIPIKRGKWVYMQNWFLTKTALKQGESTRSGKAMYKKMFRTKKEM